MSRYDGEDTPLTRWEALAQVARRVHWGDAAELDEVVAAILGDETPAPADREENVGAPTAPAMESSDVIVVPREEHAAMVAELERLRAGQPDAA